MQMKNIPFGITNWSEIIPTEHKGETGFAIWQTQQFDLTPAPLLKERGFNLK